MIKRLIILLMLISTIQVFAVTENFITYDETDEGDSNITVTASKLTATTFNTRNEYGWVNDSKGAGHFSGDFTHQLEVEITAQSGTQGLLGHWMVSNANGDAYDLKAASGSFAWLFSRETVAGDEIYFQIEVYESGVSVDSGQTVALSLNTLYYITIVRDDDGGVGNKGLYSLTVRTGSHAGSTVGTAEAESSAEQNDFEFVYGMTSYDDGGGSAYLNGYTQNLELNEGAPPAETHSAGQAIIIN